MTARRWRGLVGLAVLTTLIAALPEAARAQTTDCTSLRTRIDSDAGPNGAGRFEAALRQKQDEIARTRAYADDSGCGGGNDGFDESDSAQCRGLTRRIGQLEMGLQRLQDQASRGDPASDDRRRALIEQFNAECAADSAAGLPPVGTMPVDPDAPAADTGPPPHAKVDRVLCVRHCDGAYYPLAIDVAADRMNDMDRICQAQCPATPSSAYAAGQDEDVSRARASDGTAYSDLAGAFKFRNGTLADCACRAPNQSWADALSGAEALLAPHKGDVTVTPALAAAMSRPVPTPQAGPSVGKGMPAKPAVSPKKVARKPDLAPMIPSPDADQAPDPARDLTREFRRSDPTL